MTVLSVSEKWKVISLQELIDRLWNKDNVTLSELESTDEENIAVDFRAYRTALNHCDPLSVVVRYSKMARAAGKKLILINVGKLAEEHIKASRLDVGFSSIGVEYTSKNLTDYLS